MIFHQLLSRRLFLSMLGNLAVLANIRGNQPPVTLPLQQPLTKSGYGEGGYGEGEYPASAEISVYLPYVAQKEK